MGKIVKKLKKFENVRKKAKNGKNSKELVNVRKKCENGVEIGKSLIKTEKSDQK